MDCIGIATQPDGLYREFCAKDNQIDLSVLLGYGLSAAHQKHTHTHTQAQSIVKLTPNRQIIFLPLQNTDSLLAHHSHNGIFYSLDLANVALWPVRSCSVVSKTCTLCVGRGMSTFAANG